MLIRRSTAWYWLPVCLNYDIRHKYFYLKTQAHIQLNSVFDIHRGSNLHQRRWGPVGSGKFADLFLILINNLLQPWPAGVRRSASTNLVFQPQTDDMAGFTGALGASRQPCWRRVRAESGLKETQPATATIKLLNLPGAPLTPRKQQSDPLLLLSSRFREACDLIHAAAAAGTFVSVNGWMI